MAILDGLRSKEIIISVSPPGGSDGSKLLSSSCELDHLSGIMLRISNYR